MDPAHDSIGSLSEEAAKLFDAASRGFGAHQGSGSHQDVRGAECAWCPVCFGLRTLSPEVRTHLSDAVTAMASAFVTLMADIGASPREEEGPDPVHDDWHCGGSHVEGPPDEG